MSTKAERGIDCLHCGKTMVRSGSKGSFFICQGTRESHHPDYLVSGGFSPDGRIKNNDQIEPGSKRDREEVLVRTDRIEAEASE